ncbi:hypothetical protein WMF37_20570 [Sorangium sp. So ce291]
MGVPSVARSSSERRPSFISLGRVGHWLPPNLGEILAEALEFIEGNP